MRLRQTLRDAPTKLEQIRYDIRNGSRGGNLAPSRRARGGVLCALREAGGLYCNVPRLLHSFTCLRYVADQLGHAAHANPVEGMFECEVHHTGASRVDRNHADRLARRAGYRADHRAALAPRLARLLDFGFHRLLLALVHLDQSLVHLLDLRTQGLQLALYFVVALQVEISQGRDSPSATRRRHARWSGRKRAGRRRHHGRHCHSGRLLALRRCGRTAVGHALHAIRIGLLQHQVGGTLAEDFRDGWLLEEHAELPQEKRRERLLANGDELLRSCLVRLCHRLHLLEGWHLGLVDCQALRLETLHEWRQLVVVHGLDNRFVHLRRRRRLPCGRRHLGDLGLGG
mmetsp:Transcript_13337/g.44524  ORF Transcript_13337/g.44524 Transcript_13337/m.44524 type:complete len:343 (-) Transcript_13337:1173-2201(-)